MLAVVTGLAGCSGDLSTLEPAGPIASSVARLWWVMLAGAVLLFVLVMALFILTMLRPGFGRNVAPHRWIVLGGLVLPVPVLVPLLAYSFAQGERLLLVGDAAAKPVRIEARARMWQWEFIYLDQQGLPSTLDTLHLPAGVPVEITATSDDIIHSFWVPRLAGKIDAIPGHTPRLRLLADTPGTYRGACAEFCGVGHTAMFFTVHVHAPQAFARIITDTTSSGAKP